MSRIVPIINSDNNDRIEVKPQRNKIHILENSEEIDINAKNKNIQLFQIVQGPPGPSGNGILEIKKTSTSGLIDTYTIFFTNGTTFDYYITNGRNGDGILEWYEGPYNVTPSTTTNQILNTKYLSMSDDVNVEEISYHSVTNNSGGYTVTIGGS